MAKLRVKFLRPHKGYENCSYHDIDAAEALKLEADGTVQIKGAAAEQPAPAKSRKRK